MAIEHTLAVPAGCNRMNAPGFRPRLSGNQEAEEGEDCWVMDWSLLEDFLLVAGGEMVVAGGALTRVLPLSFKERPRLLCESYEAMYEGWDTSSVFWNKAIVRLRYRSPEYDLDGPNAYLSFSGEPSGRIITLPEAACEFSGGSRPSVRPNHWLPGYRYVVTQHRLPGPLMDAKLAFCQSINGHCNSTVFRGLPARTVVYHAPTFDPEFGFGGSGFYRLRHVFETSPREWNMDTTDAGDVEELTYGSSVKRHPESTLDLAFGF